MPVPRVLVVAIARPVAEVHAFVIDARNLPRWAHGLGSEVVADGDGWLVTTPEGPVRLAFVDPGTPGTADHVVTLGDGTRVEVPLAIVPRDGGSEVRFTVLPLPGMSQEALDADAGRVAADLATLKRLLEDGA